MAVQSTPRRLLTPKIQEQSDTKHPRKPGGVHLGISRKRGQRWAVVWGCLTEKVRRLQGLGGGEKERIFVLMKDMFKIPTLISKTLSLESSYPKGN